MQPAVACGQCIAGNGVVRSAPTTYPLERGPATAKITEDHAVPLSGPALDVLAEARGLGDGRVVFPGHSAGGALSDGVVRRALHRAGLDASPHGFRSTFRTWAQSSRGARTGKRPVGLFSAENVDELEPNGLFFLHCR